MAVRKRGDIWYIDYYVSGQRMRETIGPNKQLAQRILEKRKVQIAENRFLDIRQESTISFRELATEYLEIYAKPNKRSWKQDLYTIGMLNETFGDMLAARITRQQIDEWKAKRATKVSGARVNRDLACMKTIFNRGIDWGKVTVNPLKGIKFFLEDSSRTRFLEKGEWQALLNVCSDWFKPLVQTAFHTGMRRNEILGLRWDDMDLERRLIYVRFTKSGKGRHIPINDELFEVLKSIKRQPDNPYVFPGEGHAPLNPKGLFRGEWARTINGSGVKDFKFHDLRHTFASHLVMSGVDLHTVGQLLGHRSGMIMTMRYSHLSPAHKLDAVNRLSTKFGTEAMDSFRASNGHNLGTSSIPPVVPHLPA